MMMMKAVNLVVYLAVAQPRLTKASSITSLYKLLQFSLA